LLFRSYPFIVFPSFLFQKHLFIFTSKGFFPLTLTSVCLFSYHHISLISRQSPSFACLLCFQTSAFVLSLILPHTHEFSINLAKLPQKTILQNPRFNARKSPLWVTATCPSDQNPFIFSCTVYSCCLLFYAVQGF